MRRVRQSVASKIAGTVRLPGFRKGKTPASIVERQFGPHIEQETQDRVIEEAFRRRCAKSGLSPITQPRLEQRRTTTATAATCTSRWSSTCSPRWS